MRSIKSVVVFVSVLQILIFILHWLLYISIIGFFEIPEYGTSIGIVLFVLSISFMITQILVLNVRHKILNVLYTLASLWMGTMFFLIMGSVVTALAVYFNIPDIVDLPMFVIATIGFGIPLTFNLYAIQNGLRTRVKEVEVQVSGLPDVWYEKRIVFLADLHLGSVYGKSCASELGGLVQSLTPDVVLIGGDFFDGTKALCDELAQAFALKVRAKNGIYAVMGNHEEYDVSQEYTNALEGCGIRVLNKSEVIIDGVTIAGIGYHASEDERNFRTYLTSLSGKTILLKHSPRHALVLSEFNIDLMLCGHTHHGQVLPFTWLTDAIYHGFAYGLKKSGNTSVYTTTGARGWGPPHRWFTRPEVVLIRLVR